MVSFSPRGKLCLGYQTENHHRTTRVMAGALSHMLIFQNTRGVRDAPPTANYCLACAENSSSIVPAEHSRVREKPSSPKKKSYFRNPLFVGSKTCVFRLLSTKLQPPGGTIVTAPSGLRSRVCGQSLRPSLAPNHFWTPTTYLLLR
jgi:hypothetical protein